MGVPIDQFGHDHWNLLAYVGDCCLKRGGELDPRRMRCNEGRHPVHAVNGLHWRPIWGSRLNEGRRISEHDDWDALEDLEAAGLLRLEGTGVHPLIVLTDLGRGALDAMDRHRRAGGTYSAFKWA